MRRTAVPAGRLPRRWRIERLLRRRNSRQTVLSWLRHPTTIARTEAVAGANTRHPGRNAWAVCLRSPSVHQERTRAGSAARVRLLLSEFRRIVDLHGIIFRRATFAPPLASAAAGFAAPSFAAVAFCAEPAGFVLLPSLAADAAFVLPEPPFFAVGFAAGRSSGLLTVTISLTRGVRERNATRFRRGGRRVEMNSG